MAFVRAFVKNNGSSKNQSVTINNGSYSNVVIKYSASGGDLIAYPENAPLEIWCDFNPQDENVRNASFGVMVNLEYSRSGYCGYIFEAFGKLVDNSLVNPHSFTAACCVSDSDKPFNLTVVGFYSLSSTAFDDGCEEISQNGSFFEDSLGNWHLLQDASVVATSEDVSHLPSGVSFNGWMGNDSSSNIIVGSDSGYYDKFTGFKFFQNLPSGVIPVIRIQHPSDPTKDVFEGSDGNYYDYNGDEILSNLPQGVTPESFVGGSTEFIEGSDGNYYDLGGDEILTNLPQGVTVVSYDPVSDTFLGSDGNYYDSNGDEVSPPSPPPEPCSGELLQYSNQVRITVDCEDIFGNQVNIGGTVVIGTSSIVFPSGAFIKKINRVIVRNLTNGSSCGFGNLSAFGTVVGAKAGLDWEGVDIDGVLGEYKLFDAIFQACNTYADIVYNPNFPLGATSLTSLDYGYYCMIDELILRWEGFSSEDFPYCCDDVNETEVSGGEFGKVDTKVEVDVECICDNLENINNTLDTKLGLISDRLSDLLCICEKLDSLIGAINDKDFSITVESPVNNVTVEPCSPSVTVTNPVNNITVEPCSPSITVSPCQPTIQNVINEGDVSLDNSELIEKLDELFNTSGENKENITDVINNKDVGNNVVVEVTPNELVSLRKVFYENFDDN